MAGLAAIRYLLDTAIDAVQRRQNIQDNLTQAQNELLNLQQLQLEQASQEQNEIAIQTDDLGEESFPNDNEVEA